MTTTTADIAGFVASLEGDVRLSRDDDALKAHRIDEAEPRVVVHPANVDELSRTMAAASENEVALAPWGGGTRVEVGNRPRRLDAVVDMSGMDQVIAHNAGDLTATVQAGITFTSLQDALRRESQFLAIDPPMPDRATVGGTLAVGFGGPMKWQYWAPRDLVIGMKIVQADGTVTKSGGQVVKNVSGYDMVRLHAGGLGTLGIIAEVSFKLTPMPRKEATVVAAFSASRHGIDAALEVFRSGFMPLAITSFDAAVNDKMDAVEADADSYLAIRLAGRPRAIQRQIDESRRVAETHGAVATDTLDGANEASLWRGIADFGWDSLTEPLILARASVEPSRVCDLMETIERTMSEGELSLAAMAQPAHGTVQVVWVDQGGADQAAAARIVGQVRNAAHSFGGKAVIERCPTELKEQLDVWDEVGDSIDVMRRLKEQYDPRGLLNPGRFVGGI